MLTINVLNLLFSFKRLKSAFQTFTTHELEVFYSFVFDELLELADVKRFSPNVKEGCPFYHVMPRFVAKTMERGEIVGFFINKFNFIFLLV